MANSLGGQIYTLPSLYVIDMLTTQSICCLYNNLVEDCILNIEQKIIEAGCASGDFITRISRSILNLLGVQNSAIVVSDQTRSNAPFRDDISS